MSADCVCRYRYQLEAFIDRLRGRNPEHWYDAQDSITNMEWIEAIYNEVGHIVLSFACILHIMWDHQLLIDAPLSFRL